MPLFKKNLFALFLLLAVLLAGCGAVATGTVTNSAPPTNTAIGSPDLTITPSISPTKTPVIRIDPTTTPAIGKPPLPAPAKLKESKLRANHGTGVDVLAVSPDNTFVASANDFENSIILWNVQKASPVRKMERANMSKEFGGGYGVRVLAFSPDNQLLVGGSYDSNIFVWEVSTGRVVRSFNKIGAPIETVIFSPDGRYIVAGDEDGKIRIWDVLNGALLKVLEEHKTAVFSLVFSLDGKKLVSTGFDTTIKYWEVSSGKVLNSIQTKNPVLELALSFDGKILAGVDYEGEVKIWEFETGKELFNIKGHRDAAYYVSFHPSNKVIATGSADDALKLWDVTTGKEIFAMTKKDLSALVFSIDGKFLFTGDEEGVIQWWETN
jgi:WD40 repeat protein